MAVTTYPLNNVKFSAVDAELFHCTRTSGVFDGGDFGCTVTGADNNVTVGIGIAWIRNSKFSGKVAALKEPETLNLDVADTVNPRIDAVVLRFDAAANSTTVVIKKGVAAAKPLPPEVVQTEAVYELHLYHVRREPGAAAIPVGALTDVRGDRKYCGLMEDDVTPKTGDVVTKNVDGVDMNTVVSAGRYYGSTMTNGAETGVSAFDVEFCGAGYAVQRQTVLVENGAPRIHIRNMYNNAWGPWVRVMTNILDSQMLGQDVPASGREGQLYFLEV